MSERIIGGEKMIPVLSEEMNVFTVQYAHHPDLKNFNIKAITLSRPYGLKPIARHTLTTMTCGTHKAITIELHPKFYFKNKRQVTQLHQNIMLDLAIMKGRFKEEAKSGFGQILEEKQFNEDIKLKVTSLLVKTKERIEFTCKCTERNNPCCKIEGKKQRTILWKLRSTRGYKQQSLLMEEVDGVHIHKLPEKFLIQVAGDLGRDVCNTVIVQNRGHSVCKLRADKMGL